ncbi:MAG: methyltransferase domain-containing protein [Lentisphaeria bacterium]|nr:methyltransferase domain-containing protein [Lentisphaeria bacterium]
MELDLGCGKGGLTAAMSRAFPDRFILAADIMLGRMRKVKKKTDRIENHNVCCLRTEARFLLGLCLPDQCVDRIHILCPDPWPKDRHRGHRLLCADFMMQINRVLKEGGIFHFATDDPDYMQTVTTLVKTSGLFETAGPEAIADISGEEFRTEFERDWLAQGKSVPHVAWRALKPVFTGAH